MQCAQRGFLRNQANTEGSHSPSKPYPPHFAILCIQIYVIQNTADRVQNADCTLPYGAIGHRYMKLLKNDEDHSLELNDLAKDPHEKNNLASKQPAKTQALAKELDDWSKFVGAQLPTQNPDYDPSANREKKKR